MSLEEYMFWVNAEVNIERMAKFFSGQKAQILSFIRICYEAETPLYMNVLTDYEMDGGINGMDLRRYSWNADCGKP